MSDDKRDHEIGNWLAAARLSADWLEVQIQKGLIRPDDLRAMSADLRKSLAALEVLLARKK